MVVASNQLARFPRAAISYRGGGRVRCQDNASKNREACDDDFGWCAGTNVRWGATRESGYTQVSAEHIQMAKVAKCKMQKVIRITPLLSLSRNVNSK